MEKLRVEIPFSIGDRQALVPVYLVSSGETLEDGTTLDVFVPVRVFTESLLGPDDVIVGVDVATLEDYSGVCQGKGTCITWRALSRIGWAIRRKDGAPTATGMRVLFFAQCVMRGFLHRIVDIELRCVERAKSGPVYWEPEVQRMRDDYTAFKNCMRDDAFVSAVEEIIKGMWRRVLANVDERNRATLRKALTDSQAKVLTLHA